MLMYLRKSEQKNLFFVDILKTTDEKSRIRNQIRIRNPRIRIRHKMLRIRNTGFNILPGSGLICWIRYHVPEVQKFVQVC